MKLKGKFNLDGENRSYETTDDVIHCTHCLKKMSRIKDGKNMSFMAYVCSKDRYVYCGCHIKKNSPVCKATYLRGNHTDFYCIVKVIK